MRMYLAALVLGMFATVQSVSAAAPVFVSTADSMVQAIDEGSLYSDMVVATDADSDAIVYSLLSGPSGMTVVDTTGEIAWTPVQADVGTASVVISAVDTSMEADTLTFDIVVSDVAFAPVIGSTPVDSVYEDTQLSDQVTATDADGDAIMFTLLDGPDSMVIDSSNGTLSWMPTNEDVGTWPISVEAADTTGLADTLEYNLVVVNVNDLPEIDSYMPVAMDVFMTNGDSVVFTINATDEDSDDILTYRWLADMVEVGTANSVKISAADTMVDVMVYVYDGTDSVSMAWTATFVADFADSISPMIDEVKYNTNATLDMGDDVIKVTFTHDIDDSQLPETFGELFEALESGLFDSSAIGTGSDANDNMIEIAVNAAYDTMPEQYEGMLALKDGSVFSTALVPAKADTADIALNLVMNTNTGEEYDHVQEALDMSSAGDTLMVLGGYYEGVFNFEGHNGLVMKAVENTEPVLAYDGVNVLTTSAWLGGSCFIKFNSSTTNIPTIEGFIISAMSSEDSTINLPVQGAFNLYDCTFINAVRSNLNLRLGNAPSGLQCTVENCDFSGGNISLTLYAPNTVFRNNYVHDVTFDADWQGPNGLYVSGSGCIIENNVFENCGNQTGSGRSGGAIWLRSDNGNIFRNNVFYDCSKAVSFYSDSRNETFINNTITGCSGSGMAYSGGKNCTFINNVITGSGGTDMNLTGDDDARYYQYNLFGTVSASMTTLLQSPDAVGNLVGIDPVFATDDSTGYDLHLGMSSAGIDIGSPDIPDNDGTRGDMGAYGGPYAIDNEAPGAVTGLTAVASADSMDTLSWTLPVDADLAMVVVYRGTTPDFIPTEDAVEAVFDSLVTGTVLPNAGAKWFYKVNVADSNGYAGGYGTGANSTGPEVALSVTNLNFGSVDLDGSRELDVVISNVGTADLTVQDFGTSVGDYFWVDTTGAALDLVIPAGSELALTVTFSPDAYGSHTDTLFIMCDDPDSTDMIQAVLLYGAVKQPSISASALDFTTAVDVDSVSARSYYYINNTGDATLTVDSVYFAGSDFYFTDNITYPRSVAALGSWRLSAYFAPTAGGALTDTLTIMSSDPVNPVTKVVFSGTGTVGINDVFVSRNMNIFTLEANPAVRTLGATISIDHPRMVRVVLLSASGAKVAVLSDGFMTAGTHQLRWNGSLNAGTYFLSVEGENAVKKVIVVE